MHTAALTPRKRRGEGMLPRNLMPGPFHDGHLRPPSTPPVQDILTFSSPRLLALLSPYVFTPSLWWFAARWCVAAFSRARAAGRTMAHELGCARTTEGRRTFRRWETGSAGHVEHGRLLTYVDWWLQEAELKSRGGGNSLSHRRDSKRGSDGQWCQERWGRTRVTLAVAVHTMWEKNENQILGLCVCAV
jgi:hypothetical protein